MRQKRNESALERRITLYKSDHHLHRHGITVSRPVWRVWVRFDPRCSNCLVQITPFVYLFIFDVNKQTNNNRNKVCVRTITNLRNIWNCQGNSVNSFWATCNCMCLWVHCDPRHTLMADEGQVKQESKVIYRREGAEGKTEMLVICVVVAVLIVIVHLTFSSCDLTPDKITGPLFLGKIHWNKGFTTNSADSWRQQRKVN